MAPRALGALLAILAAIAFVVSIASSAWWEGHPNVEGHTIIAKHVRVGLLGAKGCNRGGDGSCEDVETGATHQLVGLIELGAIGLATVLAFMLAVSAWRVGDRRKGLARLTSIWVLITAAGGAAVLVVGPRIEATQQVDVPIGWGTFVFAGAVLSTLVASAITRKLEPEPLRLKPGIAPVPVAVSVPPPAAPQLRPLYDPDNAGFVPTAPQPALPAPPAPVPRAELKAMAGQFTPTPQSSRALPPTDDVDPFGRTAPNDQAALPPPRNPPTLRGSAPSLPALPRTNAPSKPPPVRSNAPSQPPPVRTNAPSQPPPVRAKAPSVPPPARSKPASVAPASPRTKPPSVVPPPRADTDPAPPRQRRARTTPGPGTDPAVTPLKPASPQVDAGVRPSQPTLAHAIPPMPSPDNLTPPPVLPAVPPQRANTDADDRLETAMRPTEAITSVEVDAEAKARAHAVEHTARGTGLDPRIASRTPRSSTEARTGKHDAVAGDITSTGVDVGRASERIITGDERALSTEQRQVARAPTEDPFETGRAAHVVPEDGRLTDELAARHSSEMDSVPVTEVHAVQSPEMFGEQLPMESGVIDDETESTSIAEPPSSQTPIPTLHQRPSTQVPISTASPGLPPPKAVTGSPTAGPTPACPQCEAPMAWVEEHLRFYCKQCRMYF